MKKFLSAFLALVLVLSLVPPLPPALAAEPAAGENGTWEWAPYSDGVELTRYLGSQTDVLVPATVEADGESYEVIRLGDGLFQGSTSLNSATLAEGVREIGDSAFAGCGNLVCIVTPQSLISIGDSAFAGCAAFNSVILYDGVTDIGAGAFEGCSTALKIYCNTDSAARQYAEANGIKVSIMDPSGEPEFCEENGITYYIMNGSAVAVSSDSVQIGESVEIPATVNGYPVTELRGTFRENANLRSVTLPNSVTVIGDYTFYQCSGLESVDIPSGVSTIGDYAFSSCSGLTQIDIPDSVTTLGEQAFSSCWGLTQITIPDSLTTIGNQVFGWCNGLTSVALPAINTIAYGMFYDCDNLEEVVLSEGTTSIGGHAFYDCNQLKNVTLPDSLIEILGCAFNYCTNLRHLSTPDNIQTIQSDSLTDNMVWVVTENSAAHRYAEENDRLYVIWDGINEPEFYDEGGITYCVMNDSAVAFASDSALPDTVIIPETVEGYPVTELRGTFRNNENLKSVTLPDSVTVIGRETFLNCYNLESVNIPSGANTIGDYAFASCSNLSQIDIPNSVTTIGEQAFASCSGLTQITIPDSLTTIGGYAFGWCNGLTSVALPAINTIAYGMFCDCDNLEEVVLSEGTTSIGGDAFRDCNQLKKVTLPDSLAEIQYGAFNYCTSLRYLLIPDGVQTIQSDSLTDNMVWVVTENSAAHRYAEENDRLYVVWDGINEPEFYDEGGITYCVMNDSAVAFASDPELLPNEVIIPETVDGYSVTELRGTFLNNQNLRSVTLPGTVIKIGNETFYGCYNLESVNIPSSVTRIGYHAFYYCVSLTQIDIPDSVTAIGGQAFEYCNGLTRIAVPAITAIEYGTFIGCSNLEEAVLSEGTTAVGSSAFYGCDHLQTVTLPDSLTEIGVQAFDGCFSLCNIVIPSNVARVDWNAFDNCTSLRQLVIPPRVEYIYSNSLPDNTVWIVTENSEAHKCAAENNRLYFVLPNTGNPDISYGTSITGTVTYTNGAPASNADVEILYDDGTVKERVQTDSTGAYTLTYAEAGRYTIRASDSGGHIQSTAVSVKRMNVFSVFLTGDPNLVLKQGYTVSGSLTPAGENATVTLTDPEGRTVSSVEASGSYRLEDIPNGSYILKAESGTGSVLREIRVYNANVTEDLEIVPTAASVSGAVEIVERDGSRSAAVWAQVSLYNSEGVLTAQTRSDANGHFFFKNLTPDDYALVAETTQMRTDKKGGYVRSHTLTGYAYLSVTENSAYDAGTVLLYEDSGTTAGFSGKVTANGQTQDSTVSLANAFRFGVAVTTTGKNGKYTFKNIPDGLYFVTAVTGSLGMGVTIVVVRNGQVYGNPDIRVYKGSKVTEWEANSIFKDIPEEEIDAQTRRRDIAEEKARLDSLSDKERQQLDQDYREKLNSLAEKAVDYSAGTTSSTVSGISIQNGGSLITPEEIENNSPVSLRLSVEEKEAHTISSEGIQTEADYVQQAIQDTAGEREIVSYYDISLTKNGQEITDISRQTDTAGKLRITMDIPEGHRGHRHYSMVHVHNGEPTSLVDLDENPNTITFEMDRFSTCALTYTDTELTGNSPLTLSPDSVTLSPGGTTTVTAEMEGCAITGITAEPENSSVVTASVNGSIITLTAGTYGETSVNVTVYAEGMADPLTDTIAVHVPAPGASVSLSVSGGRVTASVTSPQSNAVLFTAAYAAGGKLLTAVRQELTLTSGVEQQVTVPLSTEGAACVKAFLTDGAYHPLAPAITKQL